MFLRTRKAPDKIVLPELDKSCIQQLSNVLERSDRKLNASVLSLSQTVARLTEVVHAVNRDDNDTTSVNPG